MVNVTVSVKPELKGQMDRHPEMNWSEVARQAWGEKVDKLELLNEITKNSKATDKDIEELAKKIRKGMTKWHDDYLRSKSSKSSVE